MILIAIFEDLVDSSSKKKIDGQFFLAPCDRNARLLFFLRFEPLSTPEVLPSLFSLLDSYSRLIATAFQLWSLVPAQKKASPRPGSETHAPYISLKITTTSPLYSWLGGSSDFIYSIREPLHACSKLYTSKLDDFQFVQFEKKFPSISSIEVSFENNKGNSRKQWEELIKSNRSPRFRMEEKTRRRERNKKKKELRCDLTRQSQSVPESLVGIYEPVHYPTSKNNPLAFFSPRDRVIS